MYGQHRGTVMTGSGLEAGQLEPRHRQADLLQQPIDLPGFNLKPDPLQARRPADLIQALREYRIWAGDISLRAMASRSGHVASASAICVALSDAAVARDELPRLSVLMAVIVGCGGDASDQAAWSTAWRLIRLGRSRQESV
jgi:hypothetical protein